MWHTKRDALFLGRLSAFFAKLLRLLLVDYFFVNCIDSGSYVYHFISQCLMVAFPFFSEDKLVREFVHSVGSGAFYVMVDVGF